MSKKRKIGILGGTFDPVHHGHIALAKAAREAFGLDEVRLMPCAQQALKERHPTAAEDRCAMLRLAIGAEPGLSLDTRELYRSGKTYTYDTLLALRAEEPDCDFYFLLGMDSVRDFPRWHRAEELINLCHFIAFDRPGVEPPEAPFHPALLAHHLRGPLIDISSSEIRQNIAEKHPLCYAMGEQEERYLQGHQLYRKEP